MEKEITEQTIIQANTYLTYIQNLMPKALGEYGRAQDAPVMQRIMNIIERAEAPVTIKDLSKQIVNDVQDMAAIRKMVEKLVASEKVQWTAGGMLPIRRELNEAASASESKFVDFNSYLTQEELGVKT